GTASGHGELRNQRARPSKTAVVRNRVAAIDRPAAVCKPPLLKYAHQEILVGGGAGNVGLRLRPHVGWQRRRIITQSNVWTDAQIQRDRRARRLLRGGSAFRSCDRTRRKDEIVITVEQHQPTRGQAVEWKIAQ